MENELTEQEVEKIVQFKEDKVMFEAVRKVLLASIYSNGTLRKGIASNPLQNAALALVSQADSNLTNEKIGADLRALWEGVKALEMGFQHVMEYRRKETEQPVEDNPAL